MAPSKKIMLFVCLLVVATAVVVPAVAQGGLIGPNILKNLIVIRGILCCSVNLSPTVGPGGIIVCQPLSNVTVQLRCGPGNGTVISTTTTGLNGGFTIFLNSIPITNLLAGCRLVVDIPIGKCNITLPPIRTLTSNLISNGTVSLSPLNIKLPVLMPGKFVSVTV